MRPEEASCTKTNQRTINHYITPPAVRAVGVRDLQTSHPSENNDMKGTASGPHVPTAANVSAGKALGLPLCVSLPATQDIAPLGLSSTLAVFLC